MSRSSGCLCGSSCDTLRMTTGVKQRLVLSLSSMETTITSAELNWVLARAHKPLTIEDDTPLTHAPTSCPQTRARHTPHLAKCTTSPTLQRPRRNRRKGHAHYSKTKIWPRCSRQTTTRWVARTGTGSRACKRQCDNEGAAVRSTGDGAGSSRATTCSARDTTESSDAAGGMNTAGAGSRRAALPKGAKKARACSHKLMRCSVCPEC
ncbi:hypothetical protein BC628DRAFT_438618 [Trametes gibbosa]|nr:hypothetical protein BC628DRAFT_438618 [Trametes gibbosa]